MADQIQPIGGYSGSTTDTSAALPEIGFQGLDGQVGGTLLGGMTPQFSGDIWNPDTWRYTRYYEGDQYKPYDEGVDYISSLQQLLVSAGFLNPKSLVPNEWDPNSAAAYARALAYANMVGVDVDTLLNRLANGADAAGMNSGSGSGLGPAPLTDDDIKALGNKVAQGVLGRNLRDDEIANFIPAFRGATGGGTSAATAGENVVRQVNPGESAAHDVGNAMQMVSKMLGGLP